MRRRLSTLLGILRGDPGDATGPQVRRVVRYSVTTAAVLATLVGVGVVVSLLVFVLPLPEDIEADQADFLLRNLVLGAVYVVVALPVGVVLGLRRADAATRWLREDRPPTPPEREGALRLAGYVVRLQACLWLGAGAVFFAYNVDESGTLAGEIALTVTLGGVATIATFSIIEQRLDRALVARALQDAPPSRYDVPGVAGRTLMTWALTTTVPVAGIAVLAVAALIYGVGAERLAIASLVLAATSLLVGLLAMTLLARSIADPLRRLRDALAQVEAGDLDARVPVNDASEVGFVLSGFNRMVGGLRERERLQDLFGRHVGQDVARQALEEGVTLGGEERFVACLFIDLVGSTGLAERRTPTEVVELLNRFFAVVVEECDRHGGLVEGFEGDGALCVFGAPLAHPDPAGSALAAARAMADRLDAELDGVRAGIGVSAGTVVAGNVGAADRFEYTVIGDPVNEAARLTELAKERPGCVLASRRTLERAPEAERAHWADAGETTLRGRAAPTALAEPHTRQ